MPPLIDQIDGIKIEIYSREHLPVHFHAKYAEYEALVNIKTGEILNGYLPVSKLKILKRWLEENNNRQLLESLFYELNPRFLPN